MVGHVLAADRRDVPLRVGLDRQRARRRVADIHVERRIERQVVVGQRHGDPLFGLHAGDDVLRREGQLVRQVRALVGVTAARRRSQPLHARQVDGGEGGAVDLRQARRLLHDEPQRAVRADEHEAAGAECLARRERRQRQLAWQRRQRPLVLDLQRVGALLRPAQHDAQHAPAPAARRDGPLADVGAADLRHRLALRYIEGEVRQLALYDAVGVQRIQAQRTRPRGGEQVGVALDHQVAREPRDARLPAQRQRAAGREGRGDQRPAARGLLAPDVEGLVEPHVEVVLLAAQRDVPHRRLGQHDQRRPRIGLPGLLRNDAHRDLAGAALGAAQHQAVGRDREVLEDLGRRIQQRRVAGDQRQDGARDIHLRGERDVEDQVLALDAPLGDERADLDGPAFHGLGRAKSEQGEQQPCGLHHPPPSRAGSSSSIRLSEPVPSEIF